MKEENDMGIPNEKGDERLGSPEPFTSHPSKTSKYAFYAVAAIAAVAAVLYVGAHIH